MDHATWSRHQMETFSALLPFVRGIKIYHILGHNDSFEEHLMRTLRYSTYYDYLLVFIAKVWMATVLRGLFIAQSAATGHALTPRPVYSCFHANPPYLMQCYATIRPYLWAKVGSCINNEAIRVRAECVCECNYLFCTNINDTRSPFLV